MSAIKEIVALGFVLGEAALGFALPALGVNL